jgi:RNA polymerase sigma factor (sigma-70 family)
MGGQKQKEVRRRYSMALNAEQVEKFVQENMGLVHAVAQKYRFNTDKGIPYDDMVEQGKIGLMEAMQKFDPDRGTKFSTFAWKFIEGHMLQLINGAIRGKKAEAGARRYMPHSDQSPEEIVFARASMTEAIQQVVEAHKTPEMRAQELMEAIAPQAKPKRKYTRRVKMTQDVNTENEAKETQSVIVEPPKGQEPLNPRLLKDELRVGMVVEGHMPPPIGRFRAKVIEIVYDLATLRVLRGGEETEEVRGAKYDYEKGYWTASDTKDGSLTLPVNTHARGNYKVKARLAKLPKSKDGATDVFDAKIKKLEAEIAILKQLRKEMGRGK